MAVCLFQDNIILRLWRFEAISECRIMCYLNGVVIVMMIIVIIVVAVVSGSKYHHRHRHHHDEYHLLVLLSALSIPKNRKQCPFYQRH